MSMNGIRGPRGGNARNGRTTFPQYEARKARAAERKAVSDARTPEEQLKRLDAAGLPAVKERAKLAKRIAAREAAKQQKPAESKPEKKTKVAKGQASGSPAPA
jgi:hypothetical protein